MLRQSIVFLLLSSLVVFFANYVHLLTVYLNLVCTWLHVNLSLFLQNIGIGGFISNVLLLVLIPVVIAGIPALTYRLVKGRDMPYFMELTWCLWLVIILSHLLIR